ncbi:MAG: hypothetical protein J7K23_09630 [Thermoproteales archaeon]|nr:hypothetical protein [Thermoproteales archaeon]
MEKQKKNKEKIYLDKKILLRKNILVLSVEKEKLLNFFEVLRKIINIDNNIIYLNNQHKQLKKICDKDKIISIFIDKKHLNIKDCFLYSLLKTDSKILLFLNIDKDFYVKDFSVNIFGIFDIIIDLDTVEISFTV